jgi:hypothetical protein
VDEGGARVGINKLILSLNRCKKNKSNICLIFRNALAFSFIASFVLYASNDLLNIDIYTNKGFTS